MCGRIGEIIIVIVVKTPESPAPPIAAGVSATAIALGYYHTCAIEKGGGVKCWGYNGYGQLGIGSTQGQTRPGEQEEEPRRPHERACVQCACACVSITLKKREGVNNRAKGREEKVMECSVKE